MLVYFVFTTETSAVLWLCKYLPALRLSCTQARLNCCCLFSEFCGY